MRFAALALEGLEFEFDTFESIVVELVDPAAIACKGRVAIPTLDSSKHPSTPNGDARAKKFENEQLGF